MFITIKYIIITIIIWGNSNTHNHNISNTIQYTKYASSNSEYLMYNSL